MVITLICTYSSSQGSRNASVHVVGMCLLVQTKVHMDCMHVCVFSVQRSIWLACVHIIACTRLSEGKHYGDTPIPTISFTMQMISQLLIKYLRLFCFVYFQHQLPTSLHPLPQLCTAPPMAVSFQHVRSHHAVIPDFWKMKDILRRRQSLIFWDEGQG